MLKKTIDKFLRKLENKQLYFIDSSVLVEIILKQDYGGVCQSFLNSTKSSNKMCVVSNGVMGEVLCVLLFNKMNFDYNSIILAFESLIELSDNFLFVTIDSQRLACITPF